MDIPLIKTANKNKNDLIFFILLFTYLIIFLFFKKTNDKKIIIYLASEFVSEGHPDKVCDRISDMVVDSYLSKDPFSRVACETLTTTNKVVLAGEIRGPKIEKDEIVNKVRECIKDIDQEGFTTKYRNFFARTIKRYCHGCGFKNNKDEGAGDQGIMFDMPAKKQKI